MNKVNVKCCAKVLPAVYDESLSYYEAICKLANTVNDIVDIVNGNITDALKKAVAEYFDEVMISASYNEETETISFASSEVVTNNE